MIISHALLSFTGFCRQREGKENWNRAVLTWINLSISQGHGLLSEMFFVHHFMFHDCGLAMETEFAIDQNVRIMLGLMVLFMK
jgi:hypothetical protein